MDNFNNKSSSEYQRGKKETQREIAKKLIQTRKLSSAQIARITGLWGEDIDELKASLGKVPKLKDPDSWIKYWLMLLALIIIGFTINFLYARHRQSIENIEQARLRAIKPKIIYKYVEVPSEGECDCENRDDFIDVPDDRDMPEEPRGRV